MKFMKKRKTYVASNVEFCPNTIAGYSYGWWKFVCLVEGKVIFNNYNYSNSTRGHQSKVRRLMQELDINIDFTVNVHEGLSSTNKLVDLLAKSEETTKRQVEEKKARVRAAYAKRKLSRLTVLNAVS